MKLVEIRDLDGPNLFLLGPAIKVELEAEQESDADAPAQALRSRLERIGMAADSDAAGVDAVGEMLMDAVQLLHEKMGLKHPETVWRSLEIPGRSAFVFSWERRAFALAVGAIVAACATGDDRHLDADLAALPGLLSGASEADDRPEWVRDRERRVPIVGITGTNGKTTTTRLIAHILREAGRSVGWSSSSGVYINGELVLEGDYTGPSGARRVLREPGLDVAVLETARGGILLRGIAYESNDVSVFTNVSADHLDMLGVRTVEGLLAVKSTVVRVTKAGGYAVLNADDTLVRSLAPEIRATPIFVTREPENATVMNHVAAGGIAVVLEDGALTLHQHSEKTPVARVDEIPVSYGGRAMHMVENALCATGACIALGLEPEQVAAGLKSFRNSPELNPGRLHVYDVGGTTVVIDYAHNEAGLGQLLRFGKTYLKDNGRLVSVIGTAGDRSDDALRGIGALAAEGSDTVVIKETTKYLRGRETSAEMTALIAEGVTSVPGVTWEKAATELGGVEQAIQGRAPGDVVVVMCIEQTDEVREMLAAKGTLIS